MKSTWNLASIVLVALLPAPLGCKGGGVAIGDRSEERLLEEMRTARQEGRFERASDLSEELLERPANHDYTPEALLVSGKAALAQEKRSVAFERFRTLIHDYPLSEFVPEVEDDLYEIGRWYFAKEPGWFFGELFAGRERGEEVLTEFTIAFPRSEKVDDALMASGDFRFEMEEYDFAVTSYERLVTAYPDSEWADLASYRVGLCWERHSRGAGYDRTPLVRAAAAYRRYLDRPEAQSREDAESHLLATQEMLAISELKIAQLYVLRDQDRGARVHFANTVLAYPRTQSAEIARAELAQRGWDLSIHSMDQIIDETAAALRRMP